MTYRFLVQNCTFLAGTLAPSALPFTHAGGTECTKLSGAPGQGKTNPQFDFGDHVFVEHNGRFYDPSYGLGPIVGQLAYEQAAIAGLGYMGDKFQWSVDFKQSGTPQFMAYLCSPGFVMERVTATNTFHAIALRHGMLPTALFNDPLNARLKADRNFLHLVSGAFFRDDSLRPLRRPIPPVLRGQQPKSADFDYEREAGSPPGVCDAFAAVGAADRAAAANARRSFGTARRATHARTPRDGRRVSSISARCHSLRQHRVGCQSVPRRSRICALDQGKRPFLAVVCSRRRLRRCHRKPKVRPGLFRYTTFHQTR